MKRSCSAASYWACAGLLALVSTAETLADELVYREVFPTNVPTSNLSVVDWFAHGGPTATQLGGMGGPTTVHLAADAGAPSPNLAPFNSNPGVIHATGRTFHGGTVGQAQILWTSEYTVPFSTYSGLTSVGWYEAHTTSSDPVSLAVQVNGGNWYVSDQTSLPTGATAPGGWAEESIDLTSATWQELNFTPGSALSLTGPSGLQLPGGDITAFGIFQDSYVSNLRFDSFELFAELQVPLTPEPATLLMWGVGAAMVGVAIYRRRRR